MTAASQYLEQTLVGLADAVRLQPFSHPGYDGTTLHLTNVIASFRPESSARILLCAHWDTRPRADRDGNPRKRNEPIIGANDGASGVAVLLQLATLLKAQPPSVGVDIVLFDGEDYGREGDHGNYLLGSRHFARTNVAELPSPVRHPPRHGRRRGTSKSPAKAIPYGTPPTSSNMVWGTARAPGHHRVRRLPRRGDHGRPPSAERSRDPDGQHHRFRLSRSHHRYWHTHEDTPDKCSPESLGSGGDGRRRMSCTTNGHDHDRKPTSSSRSSPRSRWTSRSSALISQLGFEGFWEDGTSLRCYIATERGTEPAPGSRARRRAWPFRRPGPLRPRSMSGRSKRRTGTHSGKRRSSRSMSPTGS